MSPATVLMMSRVEQHRSRVLISDSRALIASAQALIAQSRQSIARQSYVMIVCAWCQQLLRWQRSEETLRGQISHSICFDCSLLLDSRVLCSCVVREAELIFETIEK